jgi:hypothetical protein
MFIKQLHITGAILVGLLLVAQSLHADNHFGQIVSFDDEEVEVRVNGEIDYWPANKLGKLPISILEKDDSNFVRINTAGKEAVWVSLSYVTTTEQAALKKNCQSQQLAMSESKRQFGVRGIGEACK